MKKLLLLILVISISSIYSYAQVGIGTLSPEASSILDVNSTTQGFLPPRMTMVQRDAIANPTDGLWVYNLDTDCMNYYNNATGSWFEVCGSVPTVLCVTNPATDECWMDRNLGASQVATSSTDSAAYGDLYQWGRAADGHELRTSGSTSTNATTAVPNGGNAWDGLYIIEDIQPFLDWLTPQDITLWQGAGGTNNPCPSGYRLPTGAELEAEHLSWGSNNAAGAFASPLKLPVAGNRFNNDGLLYDVGSRGYYWSSTVGTLQSQQLRFYITADVSTTSRARGVSVRCIKD